MKASTESELGVFSMKYLDLCVEKNQTLRDAMQQLSRTAKKVLFVLDDKILYGTLTDGDIRRHLLSGGKMDDPLYTAANQNPITAANREQARKILQNQKEWLFAIPIVGKEQVLLDIILAAEPKEPSFPRLGLPVVIMAGGKGTRLDPYTRVLPKPLIPVGDYPIIEHIMRQFEDYGCSTFHVIVNYKKQLMKAYFSESGQRYNVTWYDEERPLGTGGGLYLLKGQVDETFFLTNCDILLRSDLSAILQFHRENGNAITMVGVYKSLTIPYGVVDVGGDGVIEAMREKPELSFLTNTGVYVVEPDVLSDIPDNAVITFPEIMDMQRQKGKKVAVYPISEDEWMDMGEMTEMENMRKRLYGE